MPVDRSSTERIRRLRAQLQAVGRDTCPACPEEGPSRVTSNETRLSRMFGQMAYTKLNADGSRVTTSCCDSPPG